MNKLGGLLEGLGKLTFNNNLLNSLLDLRVNLLIKDLLEVVLGDIDVDTILLLLLALQQDGLHGIDEGHGVSANVQDLLDGLHDLVTLHLLELGLSDRHNEADVPAVREEHLDDKVVNALSEVSVRLAHAWQVCENLVAIHSKVRDESFLLLVVTDLELVMESLRVEQVLQVGRLLNMILALLLELDCAIGRWNLKLVLYLLSLQRLWAVHERREHCRFAASWVAKSDNNFLVISLFDMAKDLSAGGNHILQVEVLVVGNALVPEV